MDTLRLVLIAVGVLIVAAIVWQGLRKRDASRRLSESSADAGQTNERDFDRANWDRRQKRVEPEFNSQLSLLGGVSGEEPAADAVLEAQADETAPISIPVKIISRPTRSQAQQTSTEVTAVRAKSTRTAPVKSRSDDVNQVEGFPPVIVLNVMAQSGHAIHGPNILKAMHATGLEFGEMGIFHRYGVRPGDTRAIFSVANMVKPGTFEAEDMEAFVTPGLTLFMQVPNTVESIAAYDDMVDIAQRMAATFGADVCDEKRGLLTQQAIAHTRERLREFDYKLKVARKRKELEG